MRKEELIAIGVPEEVIKPLQDLEGRDKERIRKNTVDKMRVQLEGEQSDIISALVKLAKLLTLDNLNELLLLSSTLYEEQIKAARTTAEQEETK